MPYRQKYIRSKYNKKRITLFDYAGDILQAGLVFTLKDAFDYARQCQIDSSTLKGTKYLSLRLENENLKRENEMLKLQLAEYVIKS